MADHTDVLAMLARCDVALRTQRDDALALTAEVAALNTRLADLATKHAVLLHDIASLHGELRDVCTRIRRLEAQQ